MKKIVLLFFVAFIVYAGSAHAQTPTPPDTSAWFKVSDTALYKGKYKVEGAPFEFIEVVVREAKLYFLAGGQYEGFLEPIKDKKEAFDVMGQAIFTFSRTDDASDVVGLKIDYNGMVIEGKKEKKI